MWFVALIGPVQDKDQPKPEKRSVCAGTINIYIEIYICPVLMANQAAGHLYFSVIVGSVSDVALSG